MRVHQLQQLVSLLSHNVPLPNLAILEAIRQLQRHSRILQRLLLHLPRIEDLNVSPSRGLQVAANAEEVLLQHASRILCHSHVVLELSKALLRRGVNAAVIVDALAVAQWGLSVCTTHLSQAAHRIAELEEEERLRQEVELHMQQLQREGYDTARLPAQELLRLVLQREHFAQQPMDEELQDTCTSLPTMAQA